MQGEDCHVRMEAELGPCCHKPSAKASQKLEEARRALPSNLCPQDGPAPALTSDPSFHHCERGFVVLS